jgi:hypothetical protein
MELWQKDTLDSIFSHCRQNKDVLALLLFGSLNTSETDYWSDIDLIIVTRKDKLPKFFPSVTWFAHFGRLYTYEQSQGEFKSTTRVCFDDFRRIDVGFLTEENIAIANGKEKNIFHPNTRILFSRSEVVNKTLLQDIKKQEFTPVSNEHFLEMVREFRFKSILAIYKVARNDLLVALHLTLDLIRDCSVLGMILRDRKNGTNIHKSGGVGNQIVQELQMTQKAFIANGILDSIEKSNIIFERLAKKWTPEYHENHEPLLAWIEKARKEISHE